MDKNMKLYKFVSYSSLVIIALVTILLASLPIRFPNSLIAWKQIILILIPAVVLVVLLFVKPLLSNKVFLALTILFAGVAILGTIAGWMSPILLGIFLVACFALYISGNTSQSDFKRK
jgi:membrane-associated HD superfamily phosphohydrolase